MFIEKIFYEFYKNEMYGIYAKCIFPIMNNLSSTYKCNFLGADNKQ